jgi:hypothetical protein
MNTQKEVKPRPDRPLTNTNHVVVEAHGANETQNHDYSESSGGAKPCQGEFPGQGENDERVTKASKVAERHVTSRDGLVVAKERSKSIEANRKASAACFDSDKATVCPEQKKKK